MADTTYRATMQALGASGAFKAELRKKMKEAGQADRGLVVTPVAVAKPEIDAPRKKRRRVKALIAIAACLVIAIAAILGPIVWLDALIEPSMPGGLTVSGTGGTNAELPMLTIGADLGAGMGFEGFMAYDIGELGGNNPWTPDANITSLPVFENTATLQEPGQMPVQPSADAMIEKAEAAAAALGQEIQKIVTTPTQEEQAAYYEKTGEEMPVTGVYGVEAICDGVRIEVDATGTVSVWFEPALALPAEYAFAYHDVEQEEAAKTIAYLENAYGPLVNMQKPVQDFGMQDYNIYAQRSIEYSLYEGEGDLTQQILGYNFNRVTFSNDEEGKLWIIRRYETDLSNKVGEYPIISQEEAKTLLLNGNFITTVYEGVPTESTIKKVELVYRTGTREAMYMPYYRFFAELPGLEMENGLNQYGAYYVPAVEGKYITNMPMWDGSFN